MSSGRSDTAPTTNLRDLIVSTAVATSGQRPRNWLSRLPDDVQKLLHEIRDDWKDGAFRCSAMALAKSIQEKLEVEGHQTVGVGEIRKWLSESKV